MNLKTITKTKALDVLIFIKPHLSQRTIEDSYNRIIEFDLFNRLSLKNDIAEMKIKKAIIFDKITGLNNIFEKQDICSNQTLILGSLEYLKLSLEKENLNENDKNKLLEQVYQYCEDIEYNYFKNYNELNNFEYINLKKIDEEFEELQEDISEKYQIIPKLYDETVDLNVFCQ